MQLRTCAIASMPMPRSEMVSLMTGSSLRLSFASWNAGMPAARAFAMMDMLKMLMGEMTIASSGLNGLVDRVQLACQVVIAGSGQYIAPTPSLRTSLMTP